MLFYDPTESSSRTRLPDQVITGGFALPGLEKFTGADILISPLSAPKMKEVTDNVPSQMLLRKHCEHGVLVQRKSGRDALNSIPYYSNILAKMLEWQGTIPPWLLITGDFHADKHNNVVVDGYVSSWQYNAFLGATENWQLRGGALTILANDARIAAWCAKWHDKVAAIAEDPTKLIAPHKPAQSLVVAGGGGDDVDAERRMYAVMLLAQIKGIGWETANRIIEYTGPRAIDALVFLSDPANLKLCKDDERFPDRVGPSHFANARACLGLDIIENDDYERLVLVSSDDQLYPNRKKDAE